MRRDADPELDRLRAELDDLDPHHVYGALATLRGWRNWAQIKPDLFADLPAPPISADTVRAKAMELYRLAGPA